MTSSMFDASAFFGVWAFRNTEARSLCGLCSQLEQYGIQGAAISPVEAILQPEPMAANRLFLQELARTNEHVINVFPVPVINLNLETWSEHLIECMDLANGRIKAMKIFPSYHGYDLKMPSLHIFADILKKHNAILCLQLRMEDERARHGIANVPTVAITDVTSFARQHPDLSILVCAPYMVEIASFAEFDNISAEMSFVESGHSLRDALQYLDSTRLLIGTHAPLFMPSVGVSKSCADEIDQVTQHLICAGNFRRLFS